MTTLNVNGVILTSESRYTPPTGYVSKGIVSRDGTTFMIFAPSSMSRDRAIQLANMRKAEASVSGGFGSDWISETQVIAQEGDKFISDTGEVISATQGQRVTTYQARSSATQAIPPSKNIDYYYLQKAPPRAETSEPPRIYTEEQHRAFVAQKGKELTQPISDFGTGLVDFGRDIVGRGVPLPVPILSSTGVGVIRISPFASSFARPNLVYSETDLMRSGGQVSFVGDSFRSRQREIEQEGYEIRSNLGYVGVENVQYPLAYMVGQVSGAVGLGIVQSRAISALQTVDVPDIITGQKILEASPVKASSNVNILQSGDDIYGVAHTKVTTAGGQNVYRVSYGKISATQMTDDISQIRSTGFSREFLGSIDELFTSRAKVYTGSTTSVGNILGGGVSRTITINPVSEWGYGVGWFSSTSFPVSGSGIQWSTTLGQTALITDLHSTVYSGVQSFDDIVQTSSIIRSTQVTGGSVPTGGGLGRGVTTAPLEMSEQTSTLAQNLVTQNLLKSIQATKPPVPTGGIGYAPSAGVVLSQVTQREGGRTATTTLPPPVRTVYRPAQTTTTLPPPPVPTQRRTILRSISTPSVTALKSRTDTIARVSTAQKQVLEPIVTPKIDVIVTPQQISRVRLRSITGTATTLTPTGGFSFTPFTPPSIRGGTGFRPLIGIPSIPLLGGGGLGRGGFFSAKKSKAGYTPSVFAISANITTPKAPNVKFFSGGGIRPLVVKLSKKKKKKSFWDI